MARKQGSQAANEKKGGHAALRFALKGHADSVYAVAVSGFGSQAVSGSADHTARVWDIKAGTCRQTIQEGYLQSASCLHVTTNAATAISGGGQDGTARLWDVFSGACSAVFKGHNGPVRCAAVSGDGRLAVTADFQGTIWVWNLLDGIGERLNWRAEESRRSTLALALSSDGSLAVCGGEDQVLHVWDTKTRTRKFSLAGHKDAIRGVALSADGRVAVTGGNDRTIRIWDIQAGLCRAELEGHTGSVHSVAISGDGQRAVSGSADHTVWVWDLVTLKPRAVLEGHSAAVRSVALSADGSVAVSGGDDLTVLVWDLDKASPTAPPTFPPYLSAKIVLVGDSGVGKSGLGWRLATGTYRQTSSTHGQEFWVLEQLRHKRKDGTECEAILWDLAGQKNYRLIHALLLDDADLALLLLNSVDDNDPFKGVEYWLRKLRHPSAPNAPKCIVLLVAARYDVSKPRLSQTQLEEFCGPFGVRPVIMYTSAKTGHGMADLVDGIRALLPWDDMVPTVTTETFRRIKSFVLKLKEGRRRQRVLADWHELRQRLQATDPKWRFTDAEMTTAVRHVEKHGYVRILWPRGTDEQVLLRPEVLNNLAASFVQEAAVSEKGLGALDEARIRQNDYDFLDLKLLVTAERSLLLDEAAVLFVRRNLAFREKHGDITYLIFPDLINERKPLLADENLEDGASYEAIGAVEHVYAAQVVLLGYTNVLTRTNQYRDRAEYVTDDGQMCGFRKAAESEGGLELVLFFQKKMSDDNRRTFQALFERFLNRRDDIVVARFDRARCGACGYLQDRSEVIRRTKDGKGFLFCSECGGKIPLDTSGQGISSSVTVAARVTRGETVANVRTKFETALRELSNLLHRRTGFTKPSCFISYAWGNPEHERWVEKQLAADLQKAEVEVILDRWHNATIGSDVARFIASIEEASSVVVVGTPLYRSKYENKLSSTGSVVAAEVDLINQRLLGTEEEKSTIRPVLLAGSAKEAFPPLMRNRVRADFRNAVAYFATAFDLILSVHGFGFDDRTIREMRDTLQSEPDPSTQQAKELTEEVEGEGAGRRRRARRKHGGR